MNPEPRTPNPEPRTLSPEPRTLNPDLAALLAACGPVLHRARTVAQADLYPLAFDGQPALLKTFHARPAWVRWLWAGRVCAREAGMFARLAGLPNTPHLLARAGGLAFVMTRLAAVPLPGRHAPPPAPEFWAAARGLIEALHARGVAHGDLRRKNLLMDAAGREAFLIDFATAQALPPPGRRGPLAALRRGLFRRCRRIDLITYARLKQAYGAPLTAEEAGWIAAEPWYLKLGRWYKQNVYQLTKPKHRQKLRRLRAKARRRAKNRTMNDE